MEKHHRETIENITSALQKEPSFLAVILGGSIAHGYEKPDSDVDIVIVLDETAYERKKQTGKLHFFNQDLCTYEEGYIDGKFVTVNLLKRVAEKGSDPARYAFKDCQILFSRIDGLDALLRKIVTFPMHEKGEREQRFTAQLEAWRWYYGEGLRQKNEYLAHLALQKIILFSSRIILTNNERLYPYHKWMQKEVARAVHKPAGYLEALERLFAAHSPERVNALCTSIYDCYGIDPGSINWQQQFMQDSELNWIDGSPPVDDL